jgi:hypothetical protein
MPGIGSHGSLDRAPVYNEQTYPPIEGHADNGVRGTNPWNGLLVCEPPANDRRPHPLPMDRSLPRVAGGALPTAA